MLGSLEMLTGRRITYLMNDHLHFGHRPTFENNDDTQRNTFNQINHIDSLFKKKKKTHLPQERVGQGAPAL